MSRRTIDHRDRNRIDQLAADLLDPESAFFSEVFGDRADQAARVLADGRAEAAAIITPFVMEKTAELSTVRQPSRVR